MSHVLYACNYEVMVIDPLCMQCSPAHTVNFESIDTVKHGLLCKGEGSNLQTALRARETLHCMCPHPHNSATPGLIRQALESDAVSGF